MEIRTEGYRPKDSLPATRAPGVYRRHRPETTALYEVVRDNLETLCGAIDDGALARIESNGVAVARRPAINLFFGGVQAVARDPRSGALSGGGDPRRGGAVATA